jgi:hypothetical protein
MLIALVAELRAETEEKQNFSYLPCNFCFLTNRTEKSGEPNQCRSIRILIRILVRL